VTAAGHTRQAVALGGGTGLPAVLRCLLERGLDTTAVVTMADDGGSTGVLRAQLGMLPPGDVRNCLVAMAEEPEGVLARLFQYRFPAGEGLEGHALGNLVLAALADMGGSFAGAVEEAAALLGTRGRVLPCTLDDVVLHATDAAGRPVRGQANIATSEGAVSRVCMEPEAPEAYAPAIDAIRQADTIVIGPGSLYTSIIPNFLVPGVTDAVRDSSARRVYVCNVANQRGETQGMDALDHVLALHAHGLEGLIDIVIVHVPSSVTSRRAAAVCDDGSPDGVEQVQADAGALETLRGMGIRVIARDLVLDSNPCRHDPGLLCRALGEVL